jgi:hypothetical protein
MTIENFKTCNINSSNYAICGVHPDYGSGIISWHIRELEAINQSKLLNKDGGNTRIQFIHEALNIDRKKYIVDLINSIIDLKINLNNIINKINRDNNYSLIETDLTEKMKILSKLI